MNVGTKRNRDLVLEKLEFLTQHVETCGGALSIEIADLSAQVEFAKDDSIEILDDIRNNLDIESSRISMLDKDVTYLRDTLNSIELRLTNIESSQSYMQLTLEKLMTWSKVILNNCEVFFRIWTN